MKAALSSEAAAWGVCMCVLIDLFMSLDVKVQQSISARLHFQRRRKEKISAAISLP